MNSTLKTKPASFIEMSGIPKTQFASRVRLSYVSLQEWLKDNRELSSNAESRIEAYMSENLKKLQNIIE